MNQVMLQHFQGRLFLAYLLLTIIIETPVLYLIIRRFFHSGPAQVSPKRILLAGFLASFATYPYVWYVWPALLPDPDQALIAAELMVFLVEAVMLRAMLPLSLRQALMASFFCNMTTIILGSIMNELIVKYRLFLF